MRDPRGRLRFEGDRALRQLHASHEAPLFLTHPVAQQLVDVGALVPFEISPTVPGQIESPRYSFVSFPTEWTDAQLRAAADLTLDIAETALASGFELKDASAWNVIFDGTVPRFCDHLSLEPIASRQWWAFGQFCRHFTFPLACSRWRGLPARGAFQLHRDGLGVDRARAMLGLRGRLSRLAPLLFRDGSSKNVATPAMQPASSSKPALHRSLIGYARSSLIGPKQTVGDSGWSGYVEERSHYAPEAVLAKWNLVRQWLREAEPHTVLDLGCNTGEFSRLALDFAQRVIAVDADHDCVQHLFLGARGDTRLHPLVADLGDLCGGRGWAAAEFAGLIDRLTGQASMTLMLALVHHLHISEGIPLAEIAAFAARLTTSDLIVELLEPNDPMVCLISKRRQRSLEGFSVEQQLSVFEAHFDLKCREQLPSTGRHLMWMRLRT